MGDVVSINPRALVPMTYQLVPKPLRYSDLTQENNNGYRTDVVIKPVEGRAVVVWSKVSTSFCSFLSFDRKPLLHRQF